MNARMFLIALAIVVTLSFIACATKDDDLKRLETQIQQAVQKAEQASKDAAAAKAAVPDCTRQAEKAGEAATRAEAAAKKAEDYAKKAEAIFGKTLKK